MSDDGNRGRVAGWLTWGASCFARAAVPVNGKARRALLAACFLLPAGTPLLAAEPLLPGELMLQMNPATATGSARHLAWDGEARILAASQALAGVSFHHLAADGSAPVSLHDPERPTLDVLPLGENRYLLGRRFGSLEVVELSGFGSGEPAITSLGEWDIEGTPNHLVRRGDLLLISGGAAGVLVYEWPGISGDPHLRGRYPVVDFTKQIFPAPDETLVVADNFDYGMQVLKLSDPMRPEYVTHHTGDFVDTVDGHGGIVAVGLRRNGVVILDVTEPGTPRQLYFLPLEDNTGQVQRVRFNSDGQLLVSEGASGARLLSLAPTGNGDGAWDSTVVGSWPAAEGQDVRDGIFLGAEWIALAEGSGRISFHHLDPEE